MAIVTSGALSLGTTSGTNRSLSAEYGGSGDLPLSTYYAGAGLVPAGTVDPDGNAVPSSGTIKFSDFYGTPAITNIHGTAISSAYVDGQYFDQSGYSSGYIGSITDATIDSFQNSSLCLITQAQNLAGTMSLIIGVSSGSKTFNNSGFTTLNLYLGQTTNSGNPDVELDRVDANFTSNTNQGQWAWDVATLGGNTSPTFVNGIFGTSTTNNFIELV